MNVTRIAKNTTLGATLLLAGIYACTRPSDLNYKEISKNQINPNVIDHVSMLKQNSQDIVNNPKYECIGKDTIELTPEIYRNYDEYLSKLNQIPIDKSKDTTHNNLRTVLNSDKMYTNSGLDLYVPVEYYGQPNI